MEIAIFENNNFSFESLKAPLVKLFGSSVSIRRATTVIEAKEIINEGSARIIFVDSRLSLDRAPFGQEGTEGRHLASMAKLKNKDTIVVDFSLNGGDLPTPDLRLGKTLLGNRDLLRQALTRLYVIFANQGI